MRQVPRRALITGGSSGIGAALAVQLAAAGCEPVLVGRDPDRLGEVARRTGGRPLRADLTDPAGLARVADAAAGVELLINNAGAGWAGPVGAMRAEEVRDLVALNLTAPIELTRAAMPELTHRGGHVAFVSSIAALGVHHEAVYSATKAGLRIFADSVRSEGVPVTTVLPGVVRTAFFDHRGEYTRRFPRPVPPERVARALLNAVDRGKPEVFVPAWLGVAARVRGALPGTFRLLARRFG